MFMIVTLSNVMITFLKTLQSYPIFPSNFTMVTSLNSKLMIRTTQLLSNLYADEYSGRLWEWVFTVCRWILCRDSVNESSLYADEYSCPTVGMILHCMQMNTLVRADVYSGETVGISLRGTQMYTLGRFLEWVVTVRKTLNRYTRTHLHQRPMPIISNLLLTAYQL